MKLLKVIVLVLVLVGSAGLVLAQQTGYHAGMTNTVPTGTVTGFMAPHSAVTLGAVATTEANVQIVWPVTVTASNLYCNWQNVTQTGGGLTFTLRDNGNSTPLVLTVTNFNLIAANNTAATATIKAGDLVDIMLNNANPGNASGVWRCSFMTK